MKPITQIQEFILQKQIAIIGAGTAGLAAAIFLSKQGNICDLYEEVEYPEPVGAGILLQPQGLHVLNQLGILDEIIDKDSLIDCLFGVNKNNKVIMDFNYSQLKSNLFGLGIHRGQLFNSLYHLAQSCISNIFCATAIKTIGQNSTSAHLTTNTGESKDYDMIVVANGNWSTLVKHLNIHYKHKVYPWGALWKIFENPSDFSATVLNQRYVKAHTMVGLLPSGIHPISQVQCISFFWSMHSQNYHNWKNNTITLWKDEVLALWPELESFISTIVKHEDVKFVRYADTIMNKWNDRKIVIIGDAAHAMSPQLGQGANMALVDALQLSISSKQHPNTESALHDYSNKRRKHLRFYQKTSRLLTPFFQSNSLMAALFRDTFFPPMKYIPLARRHALTTLFGVKYSLLHNKTTVDLEQLNDNLKKYKT